MNLTWMDDAACRGKPTQWWHPDQYSQDWHKAKKICSSCPVQQQCLDYALSFPMSEDLHGIYGGLNPRQRDRIRRGQPPGTTRSGPKRQIITGLDDQPD